MSQFGNDNVAEDNNKSKEDASVKRHNEKKQSGIVGAMEELGNVVHCFGNKRQAEFYNETTKAIADCVGQDHNKDMCKLVNDGVEVDFKEPDEPKGDTTAHEIEKHKKELAGHCKKLDEHAECEAKVFPMVGGQCNLSMQNESQ